MGTVIIVAVVILCAVYLVGQFFRERDADLRDDGRIESPLWTDYETRHRR